MSNGLLGQIITKSIQGPAKYFPSAEEKLTSPLQAYVAEKNQYLKILKIDGTKEHIKG